MGLDALAPEERVHNRVKRKSFQMVISKISVWEAEEETEWKALVKPENNACRVALLSAYNCKDLLITLKWFRIFWAYHTDEIQIPWEKNLGMHRATGKKRR